MELGIFWPHGGPPYRIGNFSQILKFSENGNLGLKQGWIQPEPGNRPEPPHIFRLNWEKPEPPGKFPKPENPRGFQPKLPGKFPV